MNNLKRILLITFMTLTLGLVAGPAVAGNAHFVKAPTANLNGDILTVTASIAGLGNVETVFVTVTGTIDVFSQCYNRGGKNPAADNKQEEIGVNASGSFPVRNGRTNVSLPIPVESTLDCPGNQVVVIEDVSWTLTLSTTAGGGVSATFSGQD